MLKRILDDVRQELLREERRRLGELRVFLVRLGAPEENQKTLAHAIAQVDELFLLVVVGEFNSGKSSLINALIGERVLEQGVTPTTSRVGILMYGPEVDRSSSGRGFEAITAPLEILREMHVVDTPGTNAVLREHEALTREFVPRADLVLFVTSADRPFTESERAFLEAIRAWGKRVVVEREGEQGRQRAQTAVEPYRFFVRSERAQLEGQAQELRGQRQALGTLAARIEALR